MKFRFKIVVPTFWQWTTPLGRFVGWMFSPFEIIAGIVMIFMPRSQLAAQTTIHLFFWVYFKIVGVVAVILGTIIICDLIRYHRQY